MRLTKRNSNQEAFTLIELLVSIALFSVVLTVTLGSIITIADSNKKARSLMSVMNNLNFAVDSMTRSFKSGSINGNNPVGSAYGNSANCLTTNEINYAAAGYPGGGFDTREVTYCWVEDNGIGKITKSINGASGVALTSPDVDIDYLKFAVATYSPGTQPAVNIMLEGTVKISEKIRSNFSLQTTVSQRQLNI